MQVAPSPPVRTGSALIWSSTTSICTGSGCGAHGQLPMPAHSNWSMLALVCRSLRVIRALGATRGFAMILGRLRLLIVAIPAAVEHQGHQTATDNDGKEDTQPEGHPTVDAHDCRRMLPGIDHELDGHRESPVGRQP